MATFLATFLAAGPPARRKRSGMRCSRTRPRAARRVVGGSTRRVGPRTQRVPTSEDFGTTRRLRNQPAAHLDAPRSTLVSSFCTSFWAGSGQSPAVHIRADSRAIVRPAVGGVMCAHDSLRGDSRAGCAGASRTGATSGVVWLGAGQSGVRGLEARCQEQFSARRTRTSNGSFTEDLQLPNRSCRSMMNQGRAARTGTPNPPARLALSVATRQSRLQGVGRLGGGVVADGADERLGCGLERLGAAGGAAEDQCALERRDGQVGEGS